MSVVTSSSRKATAESVVTVVGGLFSPDFLHHVRQLEASCQSEADYRLARGLSLRDETGRWWRMALAEWRALPGGAPKDAAGLHFLEVLLRDILGFSDLAPVPPLRVGERLFPVTHLALSGRVPLVLTPGLSLDSPTESLGEGGRKRSPHGLLQELLNASPEKFRWGLVTNGEILRLVRENPSLTRLTYLEVDLRRLLTEEIFSDFGLFCLMCHASRFLPPPGGEIPILETWRSEAETTGERALTLLRRGVQNALLALGQGFLDHPDTPLKKAFSEGSLTAEAYHQELLRLVYRFIFLLTMEDRGLLHTASVPLDDRRRYREGYSLSRLRERSLRRRFYDGFQDLWLSLKITFSGLAKGELRLGLHPLGGLFSEDFCSHLEAAPLANAPLLEAIRELSTFENQGKRSRINYRDMDTEELGSVYESLLELHPVVTTTSWTFSYRGGEGAAMGSDRRSSGSYYTPDSLVSALIRSAVDRVIERTIQKAQDPVMDLLSLRVVDPACGSGHFLLAGARRLALEVARLRENTDSPGIEAHQKALRDVVSHCIFGVDANPLAVELCRMALWLETVVPGKPLGFLENHILCGNSLVGLLSMDLLNQGIPEGAYVALTGDDKEIARSLKKRNNAFMKKIQRTTGEIKRNPGDPTPAFSSDLNALPEETPEDIARKRTAWQQQITAQGQRQLAANLFTAAFFLPKTQETQLVIPVTDDLNRVMHNEPISPTMAEAIEEIAQDLRFFHWPLQFPEVFARGGFDIVLGNPPWEVSQLSESEFFESISPEIAALAGEARKKKIRELEAEDPALWKRYLLAKRFFETTNLFFRDSGRYKLVKSGKLNLYALFAETILSLLNSHGQAGFLVPTGIATDDTTKFYFDHLVQNGRLVSLYDFENREGLFPAVDSRQRFSLITLGHQIKASQFLFFATRSEHLADERRTFTLSSEDIRLFNPNTGTCPTFRSQKDFALTKKIYEKAGVFIREGAEDENPWGVRFSQGLFNMTSDSALFKTAPQLLEAGGTQDGSDWLLPGGARYVPLYEAKMVHHFDHRFATYEENGKDTRDVTDSEKADPAYFVRPRYWVPEYEVNKALASFEGALWKEQKRGWLLGWRDIARSTDERTVIAGVIPRVGSGDTFLLMLSDRVPREQCGLIANLSSLSFDYASRQKVGGTHLKYFTMKQFPLFSPDAYSQADLDFLLPRVLELVYTAHDMTPFARDLGYQGPPFLWDPERRALLRAELDAFYAKKYGLTREDLVYVLDPAEVCGEDYPSVTFPGLKNKEMRKFGEYRTKRLVLEAWDRLFG